MFSSTRTSVSMTRPSQRPRLRLISCCCPFSPLCSTPRCGPNSVSNHAIRHIGEVCFQPGASSQGKSRRCRGLRNPEACDRRRAVADVRARKDFWECCDARGTIGSCQLSYSREKRGARLIAEQEAKICERRAVCLDPGASFFDGARVLQEPALALVVLLDRSRRIGRPVVVPDVHAGTIQGLGGELVCVGSDGAKTSSRPASGSPEVRSMRRASRRPCMIQATPRPTAIQGPNPTVALNVSDMTMRSSSCFRLAILPS